MWACLLSPLSLSASCLSLGRGGECSWDPNPDSFRLSELGSPVSLLQFVMSYPLLWIVFYPKHVVSITFSVCLKIILSLREKEYGVDICSKICSLIIMTELYSSLHLGIWKETIAF